MQEGMWVAGGVGAQACRSVQAAERVASMNSKGVSGISVLGLCAPLLVCKCAVGGVGTSTDGRVAHLPRIAFLGTPYGIQHM